MIERIIDLFERVFSVCAYLGNGRLISLVFIYKWGMD